MTALADEMKSEVNDQNADTKYGLACSEVLLAGASRAPRTTWETMLLLQSARCRCGALEVDVMHTHTHAHTHRPQRKHNLTDRQTHTHTHTHTHIRDESYSTRRRVTWENDSQLRKSRNCMRATLRFVVCPGAVIKMSPIFWQTRAYL